MRVHNACRGVTVRELDVSRLASHNRRPKRLSPQWFPSSARMMVSVLAVALTETPASLISNIWLPQNRQCLNTLIGPLAQMEPIKQSVSIALLTYLRQARQHPTF